MSRERVEQVVAGYAAFNRGDLDVGLEVVADDVSWEVLDDFPERGPFRGKEGILKFWESWTGTFSDFRAEIEEVIDLDDDVIVVMHVSGHGHGSEAPMRTPTFAQIWTWKDNRIARVRMVSDKDAALSEINRG